MKAKIATDSPFSQAITVDGWRKRTQADGAERHFLHFGPVESHEAAAAMLTRFKIFISLPIDQILTGVKSMKRTEEC